MEKDDILQAIYKFYPRNMSLFDVHYHETDEHKKLKSLIESDDKRWKYFYGEMVNVFKEDYVRDRSDSEPAKRCVIYTYKSDIIYEIVIHLSLVADYYSYYISKAFADKVNIRTEELGFLENGVFPEIEQECAFIFNAIKNQYDYKLISNELNQTLLPDVAAFGHDLGNATIFNLLFANDTFRTSSATDPDILNYKRDGKGYIDYAPDYDPYAK